MVIPASVTGVPLVFLSTITPPSVCSICTAPLDNTLAVVFATFAPVKAATKSDAVVPFTVAVTAVVNTLLFFALA